MAARSGTFSRWFDRQGWRQIIIAVPYLWIGLFFATPFVIIVAISLAETAPSSPPISYAKTWPWFHLDGYQRLVGDSLYVRAYVISLTNAAIATLLCLLIGYPMALGLARVSLAWRRILLLMVILPFWTSFLLRIYAWMGLLGTTGWFNRGLTAIYNAIVPAGYGLHSIPMMNTNFAVILVIVYSYLPFMILPLFATLEKMDLTLKEAATDLGSRPWQVLRDITLPLSAPGMVAGACLVFIPASGELVIPTLVGNAYDPMIGRIISDEFGAARDWPMAAAIAVALLLLLIVPIMVYGHFQDRDLDRRGN